MPQNRFLLRHFYFPYEIDQVAGIMLYFMRAYIYVYGFAQTVYYSFKFLPYTI